MNRSGKKNYRNNCWCHLHKIVQLNGGSAAASIPRAITSSGFSCSATLLASQPDNNDTNENDEKMSVISFELCRLPTLAVGTDAQADERALEFNAMQDVVEH